MEWISVKDKKPDKMITAIVFNSRGYMYNVMALYYPGSDIWILFDPNYRQTLTLDVTHYMEIPAIPDIKHDC